MSDIYYSPEKYGLRVIGEVEFSSGAYEFDTFVVWQDVTTGALYSARDSGCSCPVPFEGIDRTNVTPISRTQDLIDQLDEAKADSAYYSDWNEWEVARIDGAIGELIIAATKALP